jgi:methionine--tRNA ligase beta chain
METVADYVARLLSLVEGQEPMRVLERTPDVLRRRIAGADSGERSRKPAPDRWSINEIAAHLADAEVVAAYRLRMIVAASGVSIQAFDQNRWAEAFRYGSLDALESAELFQAYRSGNLRLLGRLEPPQLDHYGEHVERGRESVAHLIRLYAGHDLNHLQQIERLLGADAPSSASFTPAAQKPQIPLELLDRIDVRVGTIRTIEPIPRATHVMRLTVDFGADTRTVVAGLKDERADPGRLAGRQALFVYNLAPRQIRGAESQAMLFDVGHADGLVPVFAVPERTVPNGVRAG